MKILLVSYFFAPANTMGALRMTRLARFLRHRGHDLRVLAAADPGSPPTLNCDFPGGRVLRTSQLDVNWLPRQLAQLRNALRGGRPPAFRATAPCGSARETASGPGARLLRRASTFYADALNWPDARAGWLPYALRAGRTLLRTWRPDLVYASSPPPTCLVLGKLLAARCGSPWIAELRDRWSDDPYYGKPAWRQTLEVRLERRIVGSAEAIVTMSEPWAEVYAEAYRKPTLVVLNGFDPEDYAGRESSGAVGSPYLEIVYTGGIYPDRRDPTPLFQALALMPGGLRDVRVHFYGTSPAHVLPLAAKAGLADAVVVHRHVPRAQAVAVQQEADVLLLMQWDDPREQGNLPGKLFEYLGARRPILGLGLEAGVPARIIRERSAGRFTNDPTQIAAQLSAWLDTKQRLGHLPALPPEGAADFTHVEQFARLEEFIGLGQMSTPSNT